MSSEVPQITKTKSIYGVWWLVLIIDVVVGNAPTLGWISGRAWGPSHECPSPRGIIKIDLVQGVTSAPMWMDGASMGEPFSSLPVPGLTKAPNSGLTHLPTFRLPVYAGPPPSTTYLPNLPTCPPIFLLTHQPIYLCTYTLNLHQGNDDTRSLRILQYTR